MDDKILKAIRENDIRELEKHTLQSVGFGDLVCDALRALSIRTISDLVTFSNKQRLITVIDALPVEDKKNFYGICRKLNIRISEEMRRTPRREKQSVGEKKKLFNAEYLSKYISAHTNNYTIAWVKAIKGTEYNLSLSYLNTLFDKKPKFDEIRSLRCYYSAISLKDFSDYCLREFSDFGVDTQFKSCSLLLTYITIGYVISSENESDEFIVYQVFNEHDDEPDFQGFYVIKKEQIEEDLLVRKNSIHFNNLFNQEDSGKHRLNKNLYRIRSHIAMQKHYKYLLERSGIRLELIKKVEQTIQSLYQIRENTSTQFFVGIPEDDLKVLKQIEESLDRNINAQDNIDELDLSIRAFNCLQRAGICTIGELQAPTEEELRKVRNLGRRSLEEVLAVMYAHGFKIKDDPECPVEYKFSSSVTDFNIRNHMLNSDGLLVNFFTKGNEPTVCEISAKQDESNNSDLSAEDTIDKIDFTVRAFNCLRRRGIETIGELTELTYDDLIKTRNLGIRNIVEVIVTMNDNGFRFKDGSEEQYSSIEAYLLDKVLGGKERILEAFPDGVLNIGNLQGRKLDFDNAKQPNTAIINEGSDELKNKIEELDAREADLDRREKELAEKQEYVKQIEQEMVDKTRKLEEALADFERRSKAEEGVLCDEVKAVGEAREKLEADVSSFEERVIMFEKQRNDFKSWEEKTRLDIAEEQKKNSIIRFVSNLEAIRAMVDAQFDEEKAVLLENSRKELERLQAEADIEMRRVQADADARIKAKCVECDALTRAADKKATDKVAELDRQINSVNSLVSSMKKVIEDIASAISVRISTLQRTKNQLQSELNAITGIFSANQRKPIESRIQQLETEMVALESIKTIIDDYKAALNFEAMKKIELSLTPDSPKATPSSAKLFSFVETATSAAIEKYVGFNDEEIVIPDTYNGKPVVAIASSAFKKCHSLKKIILGKNLRKIGEYAFSGCENLTSVVGSAQLTHIFDSAFNECVKLSDFEFGAALVELGSWSFRETAIRKFVLPPKITTIKADTFYKCPYLKSVVFHNNLLTICQDAFNWCDSLEIVELPRSVLRVSPSAFGGVNHKLKELRVLSPYTEFVNLEPRERSHFYGGSQLIVYCLPESKAQEYFRKIDHKNIKPL